MKAITVLVLVYFVSLNAFAKESFSHFVNQTIEFASEGFHSNEDMELEGAEIKTWLHNTTRIRFRPIFGLEVPWLAKIEVKPSVELIWKQKNN